MTEPNRYVVRTHATKYAADATGRGELHVWAYTATDALQQVKLNDLGNAHTPLGVDAYREAVHGPWTLDAPPAPRVLVDSDAFALGESTARKAAAARIRGLVRSGADSELVKLAEELERA